MRVLLIKLSSLGDVVHTLPAAMDMASQKPDSVIDWVVEPAFAPLLRLCPAVQGVIEMDLRRWRRNPLSAETRAGWLRFKQQLQAQTYDKIIDLQGLTKSAWVSFLAQPSPRGVRVAMAHRTEGSSYEVPTRWVADLCISVPRRIHAVDRAREVCAQAMGYAVPTSFQAGLTRLPSDAVSARQVLCVHGTSRNDKLWPEAHWIELGHRLLAQAWIPVFPHGNDIEQARAQTLSASLPGSLVWPKASLDELSQAMSRLGGVIGVDSGLSHMAVALGMPHVQIYNFDTAWRTGPQHAPHQIGVFDRPWPDVDTVWRAWLNTQGQSA